MQFKKGDKVRYVGGVLCDKQTDEFLKRGGSLAKVIDTKDTGSHSVLIEFVEHRSSYLHNGAGLGQKEACLWVNAYNIELVGKGGEKKMTKRYDAEDMRSLYDVIVVNPTEEGEIVYEEKVVARDEAEAKFNANIKEALKDKKLKLKDVDIVVVEIGDKAIRPYETVQKVKVIGGADGFKLVKTEK